MARDSRTGKIRVTYEKTVKRTSTGRLRHPHIAWAKQRALRDREQEVVGLNSKRPCGMNEMKKPLFRLRNKRLSPQATSFMPSSVMKS
jgi:hypothetical protein